MTLRYNISLTAFQNLPLIPKGVVEKRLASTLFQIDEFLAALLSKKHVLSNIYNKLRYLTMELLLFTYI